jgi:biopolymer transport protein ExbD/biopolymer transport protein TolR
MARRRRRPRFDLNADVNVVSLIDVMLLLLVIFMITAPLMQGGVDIELPKADAQPIDSKGGLSVVIDRAGQVIVDNDTLSVNNFRLAFRTMSKNKTKDGVYLRMDRLVPAGIVVQVLAIINGNGVTNVAFVTVPEDIK